MKYILKKDLPNLNKGAAFIPVSALAYACTSEGEFHIEFNNSIIENNPDWFQKCDTEDNKWTDADMEACWHEAITNARVKSYINAVPAYSGFKDYLNKISE